MKKLAIFVEGQTESIFVQKLLSEIANRAAVTIESCELRGSPKDGAKTMREVHASKQDVEYYILVVDCGADNKVASDIRDHYEGLVKNGYQAIIGIRDVHPILPSDISKLRSGLGYKIPTKPIQTCFVLGVMEIESWFLSDHSHFARVHYSLGPEVIYSTLGFHVQNDDMQLRPTPAKDLHDAYAIAGFSYRKKRSQVQRTVDALDYEEIYLNLKNKIPDLARLTDAIDAFLAA